MTLGLGTLILTLSLLYTCRSQVPSLLVLTFTTWLYKSGLPCCE